MDQTDRSLYSTPVLQRALTPALCLALVGAACSDDGGVDRGHLQRPHPVVVAQGGGDAAVEVETRDTTTMEDTAPETTILPPDTAVETAVEDTLDTQVAEVAEVETTPTATFPFVHQGDTRQSTRSEWDRYACAPDTDESGAEDVFVFEIEHMGILRASVDDVSGDGVDVDVHLLAGDSPDMCVRRNNVALAWVVRPGTWTVVVDTWVGSDGVARAGNYRLEVELLPLDQGRCALDDVEQRMFWRSCSTGPPMIDCTDDGTTRLLRVPSLGPVVAEAHLVTMDEDFSDSGGWPTSRTDGLERHYAISQAASGYVMERDDVWAPEGEGGSMWGQGSAGKPPPLDEAWYVNMYWRDRPRRGRRMLVVEPWSGKAVVAAGGWETGPGSNTAIGGAVEEIHHYLGSRHRQDMVMGYLSDDELPLGPIVCW